LVYLIDVIALATMHGFHPFQLVETNYEEEKCQCLVGNSILFFGNNVWFYKFFGVTVNQATIAHVLGSSSKK